MVKTLLPDPVTRSYNSTAKALALIAIIYTGKGFCTHGSSDWHNPDEGEKPAKEAILT
jgi:hypothetical protein